MPPKGKGKKGKKGDDDDFWANAGESVGETKAPAQPASKDEEEDAPAPSKKSAFASLDVDAGEEDDGQDNFMAMLQKRKEKRKPKKGTAEADEPAADDDITKTEATPAPAKSMTAEELADEEFGPVKEKNKKKKGKDKKAAKDDEGAEAGDAPTAPAETADAAASGDEDGEGTKILSKKEKEKLKKEKEKAKKKAQAAAKKAQGGAEAGEDKPTEPSAPAPEPAEAAGEDDEGEGGGESAAKKKKKKGKKKANDDDEPAPAPAPAAKGKKAAAGLAALRAALEEKKRAEEEAKRKEEEERKRIEEEERAAEEAARKKEEEKQRKKDKAKAKMVLAKQEGRLLTDKQKKERHQAEIRRQALIASGAIVEGLNQDKPEGSSAPKKVVYGKRQRGPKQAATAASVTGSSTPSTPQTAPATELPPEEEPAVVKPVAKAAPKEEKAEEADWDASSAEEDRKEKVVEETKDDWDASSDDEKKTPAAKHAAAQTEPKSSGKPAPSAATPKQTPTARPSAPASKTPAQPATKAPAAAPSKPGAKPISKATAPPESSSEEESESESESESDSDDDSDDSDEDSSDEDKTTVAKRMEAERKAAAAARRQQREADARAAASKDNLRSPICCILGHVDTGKTKLLDKIRQTNVQEGEAGGITQQIGATYFPIEAIKQKTAVVNKDNSFDFKIPGLLIIDTPGHESFTNLRSRGSSLCNIAILVVDIMHGLEPQTIESIGLLKQGSTPFIIALNKIDRLYGWKAIPDNGVQDSLEQQNNAVKREFETRSQKVMLEIAEQGLNSQLYWKNTDPRRVVNVVPTSAITGEGVPDMIKLLVDLTQTRMVNSLMYISTLECTVLEVKVVEGLGTTIDVILSNGYLREGDKIVICGLNGPIVTQVRALLTPQPLRELRIKSAYVHNKEVKAANGVKIAAPDLEKAIAGSKLLVCGPDDDEDDLIEEVMRPLEDLLKRISKTQTGVHVQASTLGSLEALLAFLESSKIPVSGIQIGPVHKKDVRRAMTQLEKAQEMACILCFDVPVDKEAEKLAEESGVKLFKADIIYHLFDAFTAYNKEITEAKRRDQAPQAVWPCRLKIIAVFTKRDPILLGVDIIDGSLRVGTPLCVVKDKQIVKLGRIASLHINHKPMEMVKKSQAGGGVAVKIDHAVYETPKMVGRHFDENDEVLSLITRQSIDVLKDTFRNDVTKDEWLLIKNLKGVLGIP